MQSYLTPEEAAQHLGVEPSEILALVEQPPRMRLKTHDRG
jgi:hypothetical protein